MIRIALYDNGLVGYLNLGESNTFPLAITYEVGTIQQILKRTGTKSKPFKVPGTKNNSRLLKMIYNSKVTDKTAFTYNAVIYKDGIQLDTGVLRLSSSLQDENPIEYEFKFYSNNNTWAQLLKDKFINDYDFNNPAASGNFVGNDSPSGTISIPATTNGVVEFTQEAIELNWQNTDYGNGWDYTYALKQFGQWRENAQGLAIAPVSDVRPDVYARAILREAFESIGWTISSTFLDSANFTKLIIPCTGEYVHKSLTNSSASLASTFNFTGFPLSPQATQSIFIPGTTDVRGVTYPDFVNAAGQDFTFFTTGEYPVTRDTNASGTATATVENPTGELFDAQLRIRRIDAGGNLLEDAVDRFSFNGAPSVNLSVNYDFDCAAGESIQYRIVINTVPNLSLDYNITSAAISIEFTDRQEVLEGESFSPGYTLPKIQVTDFINYISNVFNLYFWSDSNKRVIYIEPRQNYYSGISSARDWSGKLDMTKIQTLHPSAYKRELRFKYKTDSADGWMKAVNEERELDLGELRYDLSEYFIKGKEKLGTGFNFTDWVYDFSISTVENPIEIPRLWRTDEQFPESQYKWDIRLLYYKGFERQTVNNGLNAPWRWVSIFNIVENVPFATMQDDSFPLLYTGSNGLIKTYYTETIGTIEDNRIVVGKFNLSPSDINILDLRIPIYLTNGDVKNYYYINRVIDYNSNKLTEVELIPVIQYNTIGDVIESPKDRDREGQFAVGKYGKRGELSGTVLHNGTNYSLNDSVAIGNNLDATLGDKQHVYGNSNYPSATDIVQVGGGVVGDRTNLIRIDSDGEFMPHGGYIYKKDGTKILTGTAYVGDEISIFEEIYLKGNKG